MDGPGEIQLKSADKNGEVQGTETVIAGSITRYREWRIKDKEGKPLKQEFTSVWLSDGSRIVTPLSKSEFQKLKGKANGKG